MVLLGQPHITLLIGYDCRIRYQRRYFLKPGFEYIKSLY